MEEKRALQYIESVLENMPADWLHLTTHRLDIYEEKSAKVQFLERFEALFGADDASAESLAELPTAFDYIRLGHPLSCVLEWLIARGHGAPSANVITFSSKVMGILAILRTNALSGVPTRIVHTGDLPEGFDPEVIRTVYEYPFETLRLESEAIPDDIPTFEGTTILIGRDGHLHDFVTHPAADFTVNIHARFGSVVFVSGDADAAYVPAIQHVRRRESIAMTPADCYAALAGMVGKSIKNDEAAKATENRTFVLNAIKGITATNLQPLLGSSGLSVQYAIMMGLIHDAKERHPGKAIKIIIPPNCYGGTNDQARRVAASVGNVEVVDLPVDDGRDMVSSVDLVLDRVAAADAVPYIIAEIPTNPRVEVPDLPKLRATLGKARKTTDGAPAITPVFILDQTFCPNVHFLSDGDTLSGVRAIAYASGSKFPSGGLCTAGYCVGNDKAAELMERIGIHLDLCDNGATDFQIEILAAQLPSMNERIHAAYLNTRRFVDFIERTLPTAKMNFVSEDLARVGFTPSVFSLALPAQGATEEEREANKRALNYTLINSMIEEIPEESKFCVSYGQLKGCYWTIPATSTQGTTREGDKDYIIRASLSPDLDLERHEAVFTRFVEAL